MLEVGVISPLYSLAAPIASWISGKPERYPSERRTAFLFASFGNIGRKKGLRVVICVVVEAPPPDRRATFFEHTAAGVIRKSLIPCLPAAKWPCAFRRPRVAVVAALVGLIAMLSAPTAAMAKISRRDLISSRTASLQITRSQISNFPDFT